MHRMTQRRVLRAAIVIVLAHMVALSGDGRAAEPSGGPPAIYSSGTVTGVSAAEKTAVSRDPFLPTEVPVIPTPIVPYASKIYGPSRWEPPALSAATPLSAVTALAAPSTSQVIDAGKLVPVELPVLSNSASPIALETIQPPAVARPATSPMTPVDGKPAVIRRETDASVLPTNTFRTATPTEEATPAKAKKQAAASAGIKPKPMTRTTDDSPLEKLVPISKPSKRAIESRTLPFGLPQPAIPLEGRLPGLRKWLERSPKS